MKNEDDEVVISISGMAKDLGLTPQQVLQFMEMDAPQCERRIALTCARRRGALSSSAFVAMIKLAPHYVRRRKRRSKDTVSFDLAKVAEDISTPARKVGVEDMLKTLRWTKAHRTPISDIRMLYHAATTRPDKTGLLLQALFRHMRKGP
jgi:hypothetical protein